MLTGLSIRDVVLIDRLDLAFHPGLCVLTGETGAGKSILLDALGLALGGRSEATLIRSGADQAVVTASFDAPADHPVRALLAEQGLDGEDAILVRRVVNRDGRSRAFINDQPTSVGMLRQAGDLLVEVHGQYDQRGLLDPATHRALLDDFGGLTAALDATRTAWDAWKAAEAERDGAAEAAEAARAEEDYLRDALDQLTTLAPEADEEDKLIAERNRLMNSEKLVEALNAAAETLTGREPVDDALRSAQRQIERARDMAPDLLDPLLAALERAAIEVEEARAQLDHAGAAINGEPGRLETVDDRLFALRDAARKHRVAIAALPALREELAGRLALIEDQSDRIARLDKHLAETAAAYETAARALSAKRKAAAAALDKAVAHELPPLKLEKARFVTQVDPLPPESWSRDGVDRVRFEAATNPGATPGPIAKIASGGELARFTLALKVVLSRTGAAPTLIFDEVDSGIGGATAAAVGERLGRLGDDLQVLVVTHSPQVAARGGHHWRVSKAADDGSGTVTRVSELDPDARREEIARMLAGHDVTEEARAAARVLIAGGAA